MAFLTAPPRRPLPATGRGNVLCLLPGHDRVRLASVALFLLGLLRLPDLQSAFEDGTECGQPARLVLLRRRHRASAFAHRHMRRANAECQPAPVAGYFLTLLMILAFVMLACVIAAVESDKVRAYVHQHWDTIHARLGLNAFASRDGDGQKDELTIHEAVELLRGVVIASVVGGAIAILLVALGSDEGLGLRAIAVLPRLQRPHRACRDRNLRLHLQPHTSRIGPAAGCAGIQLICSVTGIVGFKRLNRECICCSMLVLLCAVCGLAYSSVASYLWVRNVKLLHPEHLLLVFAICLVADFFLLGTLVFVSCSTATAATFWSSEPSSSASNTPITISACARRAASKERMKRGGGRARRGSGRPDGQDVELRRVRHGRPLVMLSRGRWTDAISFVYASRSVILLIYKLTEQRRRDRTPRARHIKNMNTSRVDGSVMVESALRGEILHARRRSPPADPVCVRLENCCGDSTTTRARGTHASCTEPLKPIVCLRHCRQRRQAGGGRGLSLHGMPSGARAAPLLRRMSPMRAGGGLRRRGSRRCVCDAMIVEPRRLLRVVRRHQRVVTCVLLMAGGSE